MKISVKLSDIIIIILVTGITLFSAYSVYMKPRGIAQVLIRGQESEWTFPVDAQETIIVRGTLGNTVVRINGGKSWIESSPCENHTCVAAGTLTKQGQWAACLPNSVLLMIRGDDSGKNGRSEGEKIDAVVW